MTKNDSLYKFVNVRFKKTSEFDDKALKTLDSLCSASGKSQTYIIKELLIRYGSAAINTAVFDLNETGLGEKPQQKASQNGSAPPVNFSLDALADMPHDTFQQPM